MSKCRYCNSSSYGSGCPNSPTKKHEHNGDEKNVNIVIHLVMDQVARIVLQRSIDTEVVIISVVGVAQLVLDLGVRIALLKSMKNK
jgi:hypothetical protein